jgi:Mlc titration factor MtfA (ptsG expression regulator)
MEPTDALAALLTAAFLAALGLVVAGWIWGPAVVAGLRRARVRRQPFPRAWREVLRQRMPAFARLPADVQLQLKKHAQVLIAEKPFIGCAGLTITDEMRVLVAVQASLLLLNRHAGYFGNLRQILIYPGAFVVARQTADGSGLTHDTRRALAGESWQQGQVLLSWDDVLTGAADPQDGQNVVLHEFAHQLDQEAGAANGAPWLAGRERRARWARVMNTEFSRLREGLAGGEPGLFGDYAASEPAEFFAVATEIFFERPLELAQVHPALYFELQQYYRADPLHWLESSPMMARTGPVVGAGFESNPFRKERDRTDVWPLRS